MGIALLARDGGPPRMMGFVVPRGSYEVLDDWGASMGMKGSGSHGARLDDTFVPDHLAVDMTPWMASHAGPTVGSELHGDSVYAGAFEAFAEGEIAAIAAGLGEAAVDEFEEILLSSTVPMSDERRVDHHDFQRSYGLVRGWVDAAGAISREIGRQYEERAARSVIGAAPYASNLAKRQRSMAYVAEQLVWDAVERMLRTSSSRASADGQRLQRYFRDMVTMRTRADQFEFDAYQVAQEELGPKATSRT